MDVIHLMGGEVILVIRSTQILTGVMNQTPAAQFNRRLGIIAECEGEFSRPGSSWSAINPRR
jgi:hypothetical protein